MVLLFVQLSVATCIWCFCSLCTSPCFLCGDAKCCNLHLELSLSLQLSMLSVWCSIVLPPVLGAFALFAPFCSSCMMQPSVATCIGCSCFPCTFLFFHCGEAKCCHLYFELSLCLHLCLLSSIYKYKPISTKLGHNEYEHRSQMSLIMGQVIPDQ